MLRGKNGQQLLLHFNQTPSVAMATDGRQLVYNSLQLNERSFIQIGMQIEFFRGSRTVRWTTAVCPPPPPPTPWTTRTRSACRPVRQTCGAGVGGAARPCGVKKNQYTSHRRGNTIHAGFELFFSRHPLRPAQKCAIHRVAGGLDDGGHVTSPIKGPIRGAVIRRGGGG